MKRLIFDSSMWLLRDPTQKGCARRLVCFPWAGGAAAGYWRWHALLPEGVELILVELPGRGARWGEPCLTDWRDLVSQAANAVGSVLDGTYSLFGHSMGALIAFEVARKLRRDGYDEPECLVVSGHPAPHSPKPHSRLDHLSDDQLVQELGQRYDAIPRQVFENPDLLRLVAPRLRADLQLLDGYAYHPEPALESSIVAFGGYDDPQSQPAVLQGWSKHTASSFDIQMFPGRHFFLESMREAVVNAVCDVTLNPSWHKHSGGMSPTRAWPGERQ